MTTYSYKGEMPERYKPCGTGFRRAALELAYAESGYETAQETPEGTDCSGSLRWAFTRIGFPIGMDSVGFAKNVFTDLTPELWPPGLGHPISAIFMYTTVKLSSTYGYVRGPHEPVHVTPRVGENCYLDAFWKYDIIEVVSLETMIRRYTPDGLYFMEKYALTETMYNWKGYGVKEISPEAFDYTC